MIPVSQPVLEALARAFGAAGSDLQHYAGGREESDGVIYTFPYGGAHRLLKIMALPAEGQRAGLFRLDERLKFAHYLGAHGARLAYPQPSPQGALYETFPHSEHLWVAYAMDPAPGKTPSPRTWDPALFRAWGQTVGMLHRLARSYPSWRASRDPESGAETLTWREEVQSFSDWCQEEDVRAKWQQLGDYLATLPMTRETCGFIHNDPHLWNLLVDGDTITLLDFDVANHHWFLTDIAIACQSVLFVHTGGMERPLHDRDKLLRFLDLFLEGYQCEHTLPAAWLNRLDTFIAYRRILLFIAMYGGIRANPEALASWKDMILTQPELLGNFATPL